jgi:signal transduction histidine kinase
MIIRDKYIKRYFIASLLFLLLFIVVQLIAPFTNNKDKVKKEFQQKYLALENEFNHLSGNIFQALQIDSLLSWEDMNTLTNNQYIRTYLYHKDSLIFWNNYSINPEEIDQLPLNNTGIYHFNSGWFAVSTKSNNNWKVVLFRNIIQEYSFSNEFLNNAPDKFFFGDYNVSLIYDYKNEANIIYNSENKPVITLYVSTLDSLPGNVILILVLILLLGYSSLALLIIRVSTVSFILRRNSVLSWFIVALNLIIIFVFIANWGIPSLLQNSFWFSSWHNILPLVDSRGLVVLFITFIVILAISFSRTISASGTKKQNSYFSVFIVSLLNITILFFLLYTLNTFYTITLKWHDNAIGFLFRRDLIELYIISGIVIAIYFFQHSLIRFININRKSILLYAVSTAIFSMIALLVFNLAPIFYLALFLIQFLFIVIIYVTPSQQGISFLRYLLIIVLLSIGFSVIINDTYSKLKNQMHIATVKNLIINRDNQLESTFNKINNNISNDPKIETFIDDPTRDTELTDYIQETYFNNNFRNYDIQLTVCRSNDYLEISPEGNLVECEEYFNNLVSNLGSQKIDSSLVLMNEEGESRYYLGKIELALDSTGVTTLYVEMFSSVVPSGLGYPELLVDNSNQVDLLGYSMAKFHHNVLVYKMGEYDYHSSYSFMQPYPNDQFYFLNNYLHYKVRINNSDVLIVSRPVRTYAEQTATFSMLFLLFSFLAVIVYFLAVGRRQINIFKYSFRTRLQVFIMASLLVLFILMSAISGYYFNDTRQTFILNQLNEKTKSVLIELQHKFASSGFPNSNDIGYLQNQLRKLSIVFFTDINIYDRSGELIASSRPKIFETGLFSRLINPTSYQQVMINKKLFFLTEERIGTLHYYSAYVPLTINSGPPIGILNLPYFARQSEVKKSFMPMLFNYLNIFVIIGILGTFLALIIAKILTRPLAMLQQSLSEIRIDKKNEPLVWKNDDEIGQLIAEYNLMVNKLEESANLLKRSERETAWREVAQQVAHEIRNPLTPMKLNIQYLQKAYVESNEDFSQKWKTLSDSLIHQIETLNEVASTFSDLASTGITEKKKIDIIQILLSAIDLYENKENVTINLNTTLSQAYVLARQGELLRVFNNLIKNAVQSLLPRGGEINITISSKNSWYEISFSDNGKGIADSMKEKIFQPYFTTKSGGTGIGLAIVKNIIDEMGGEISFSSVEGEGTQFTIKLKTIE